MLTEMLIRVVQSSINEESTVAWMSGIWNKGKSYCNERWCYQD